MKKYVKNNIIKLRKDIIIEKDGYVTYNPTEEMVLEDGWVEYVYKAPELTEEEKIERKKEEMLRRIDTFDQSDNVNLFYIQNIPVWLDKATRAGLKLRFEAEMASGKKETSLWHNNVQFPLPLDQAIQMLYALELYASECYDQTQYHKMIVTNLTDFDEVNTYDYTIGYPEKLKF